MLQRKRSRTPATPPCASPSLRVKGASCLSPSLRPRALSQQPAPASREHEHEHEHEHEPDTNGCSRLVRIRDRIIPFQQAACKRESRAARPNEPSVQAREACRALILAREADLKAEGRAKMQTDDELCHRAASGASGKGPAIRSQIEREQAKMNHISQLKARNVETYNTEASFLLWGNVAEQCYDKLAEAALRANAGNSSVTKRRETQGAAFRACNHEPAMLALALARRQANDAATLGATVRAQRRRG